MSQDIVVMPTYDAMLLPTVEALKSLGGSGTIEEIYNQVAQLLEVPDEVLEIMHGNSTSQTEGVIYIRFPPTLEHFA